MSGADGAGLGELRALDGAFVVLGVTGGIAAYKAVEICRRLVDAGAHVAPVMTEAATRFVGAATFSALASEAARTELFGGDDPIPHTRLGRRADLVVVAPATARLIGEYAGGICTDLLGATLLATAAPVVLCPAMHTEMWQHPAVQENLATLRAPRRASSCRRRPGRLAGGDVGEGRLAEPATVVAAAARVLAAARSRRGDLAGVRVLVTAGGTREPIDPVRYLANRSSGTPGPRPGGCGSRAGCRGRRWSQRPSWHRHRASRSSRSRRRRRWLPRSSGACGTADVVVMAAAVADFRPKAPAAPKAEEARRGPRARARADRGHPRRARPPPAAGPGAGRLRRRDRRGARAGAGQSSPPRGSTWSW